MTCIFHLTALFAQRSPSELEVELMASAFCNLKRIPIEFKFAVTGRPS